DLRDASSLRYRDYRSVSLKIVRDRAVETAALSELRRADSNAAAVAQLVDFVEQIDDIEADFEGPDFWNRERALQREVDRFIRGQFARVDERGAQAVSVKQVGGNFPI